MKQDNYVFLLGMLLLAITSGHSALAMATESRNGVEVLCQNSAGESLQVTPISDSEVDLLLYGKEVPNGLRLKGVGYLDDRGQGTITVPAAGATFVFYYSGFGFYAQYSRDSIVKAFMNCRLL